jgi:LTXXQ motif family protein
VRKTLLAVVLAATGAITAPIIARSAPGEEVQQAQAGPGGEHSTGDPDGRPGHWMHAEGGPGMGGWHGMIRHRMMHADPQERCVERLAWRAAMRAYTEAKLNLTAEQRPLWDKVQSAAQTEEQKERQLCASLKSSSESTLLERLARKQQFLSTRLEGLQAATPSVQALYQALTPEQRAILDHPFRR